MKVAILLVGNVRSWELCKENFKEVFSHLNPDVYISTYDLQYDHHPYIQGVIQDADDSILSNEEIEKMFSDIDVKSLDIECSKDVVNLIKLHDSFLQTGSSFSQWRKFQKAMQQLDSVGEEYDCVIKTRCDIMHNTVDFTNIDLSNTIIIDSGNVFPNDCFFATNQESMKNIANFIISELEDPRFSDSHISPPHNLFKNAIVEGGLNVNAQKIMNCVIRKNAIKFYY
jgi:hypothetical protein